MNPIRFALRHPISIVVFMVALLGSGARGLYRARAFVREGKVPAVVMRFHTGSVPVGYMVFSSENPQRTLGRIAEQALFRVRPMFAKLPGVSAPPPFGSSARAITVNVNPDKMQT